MTAKKETRGRKPSQSVPCPVCASPHAYVFSGPRSLGRGLELVRTRCCKECDQRWQTVEIDRDAWMALCAGVEALSRPWLVALAPGVER